MLFDITNLELASLLDTAGIIALGVIMLVLARKYVTRKSGTSHS